MHGLKYGWLALVAVVASSPVATAQSVRNELGDLARFRSYTNHRVSSYDRSGRNDDGARQNPIQPGETRTMAEIDGPGIISHIWITIDSPEWYHLKKIVLRMYWDGESEPSVEAPIGDFFGLGLGKYFVYESSLLSVGSLKALNAFFPMPFRESARVTVTNEGEQPVSEYYYLGAWCYGGCGINPFGHAKPTFAFQRYGNPMNGGDNRGAEWMVYRHHTESPVAFQDSIRVTMERGHANHRADNWYTVAYWYQAEPHAAFPPLPAAADRVPQQVDTGGPTIGKQ